MPMAASAQTMDHGMHMPAPTPTPSPAPAPKASAPPDTATRASPPMDHDMPMPGAAPAPDAPQEHRGHHPGMAMPGDASATEPPLAYGSGTSRLPANEGMMRGLHIPAGDWMVMLHGYAWAAYTDRGGRRGDDEAFVQSMAMLSASGEIAPGVRLGLQSMLSLEPLMGAKGYPNLFATGETADGTTHLVDRQHPHDLFMELSGRVDVDIAPGTSLFLYGGPVAEPALGPSAFMHRGSAQYLPLAPITHHWFDSTHITYGVVTAGVATSRFQLEASAFHGREPDQYRWNIETPKLDSWSVRATWTPSPPGRCRSAMAGSRAPSSSSRPATKRAPRRACTMPGADSPRPSPFPPRRISPGRTSTAWLAEANWNIDRHHTLFGRVENVANDELFPDHADPLHDRLFRVSRFEGGYAWRLKLPGPFGLALGGALAAYAKPAALGAAYGDAPVSYTLFAKLSLGQ